MTAGGRFAAPQAMHLLTGQCATCPRPSPEHDRPSRNEASDGGDYSRRSGNGGPSADRLITFRFEAFGSLSLFREPCESVLMMFVPQ
jgi:hypothetical protein